MSKELIMDITTESNKHRHMADSYHAVDLLYSRRLLSFEQAKAIVRQIQVENPLRLLDKDRDFVVDCWRKDEKTQDQPFLSIQKLRRSDDANETR